MILLAIDPGVSTGWAVFAGGTLTGCGAGPDVPAVKATHMVIEVPMVYPHGNGVDPNDLITLALQAGRYIERYSFANVFKVFPREWKMQQKKDAHHPKIYGALTPKEQDVCAEGGRRLGKKALGDMLDAIGLGLWFKKQGHVIQGK